MKDPFEISVIIPAYNCKRTLNQVILNLIDQSKGLDGMEIIVVDDGSTDGTKDWLEKIASEYPGLVRCFFQKNRGVSATRNRGISNANGKIILFLDADVIPSPHLIQEHVKFHREHPEIHISLLGKIPDIDNSEGNEWVRPRVGVFKTKQIQKNDLPWIEFITGNISLKRSFLEKYELRFNENLFANEDVEFGFRAKQCGMILHFSEKAVGFHDHPITLKSYLNKGKLYGRGYALWYFNFPGLKEELEKFDREHFCGFIGANRPMLFKVRQYIKRIIANSATAPLFLFIGNILFRLGKNTKFFWFYRQVNEINFRTAFRQRMNELRYNDEKLLAGGSFQTIFSTN